MIATDQLSDKPEKIKTFDFKAKETNIEEFKQLQERLSVNFDNRHSKVSLVKLTRKIIGDLLVRPTKKYKEFRVRDETDKISEFLTMTLDTGVDISINVSTHKVSLHSYSIGYGVTLPTLNQSIEKASSLFDLNTKIQIRKYFWDLITSSSNCSFDCNVYPGEFVFRYLDKPSRTTVEVIIMK